MLDRLRDKLDPDRAVELEYHWNSASAKYGWVARDAETRRCICMSPYVYDTEEDASEDADLYLKIWRTK